MVVKKKAKRKLTATEEVMGRQMHRKANTGNRRRHHEHEHDDDERGHELTDTVRDVSGAVIGLVGLGWGVSVMGSMMNQMNK